MKNAFTLIELVGVISLLAVIALVAIPAINNSLIKSRDKLSSVQESQIIKGAKDYYSEHLNELPEDGKCIKISIETLKNNGYISDTTINPENSEEYANYYVIVTKKGSSYEYDFTNESDKCEVQTTE